MPSEISLLEDIRNELSDLNEGLLALHDILSRIADILEVNRE